MCNLKDYKTEKTLSSKLLALQRSNRYQNSNLNLRTSEVVIDIMKTNYAQRKLNPRSTVKKYYVIKGVEFVLTKSN